MWFAFALLSAFFLGLYDTFKKEALTDNAVIPVLFLNTLLSSCIFLPFILLSYNGSIDAGSVFHVSQASWAEHRFIILKAVIVLSSWILGYFGIKHLPLTIVGPINATRPVIVLLGALLFFGERLNVYQWIGVILAIISFFMLSRSSKKEGIDFKHNSYIYMIVGAALLGAASGLYDKFLMAPRSSGGAGLQPMLVQSWYTIYQMLMMGAVLLLLWMPRRRTTTTFRWHWAILGVSLFLSAADFVYFYALSLPDAMISVVSMIRRGSVLVSFSCGALFLGEKNLRSKAVDLLFVLLGMVFLFIGSK